MCLAQDLHTYCISKQARRLVRVFAARILIDFWLTVKAATLIFKSGRGKEGKSGSIYNLMKNK